MTSLSGLPEEIKLRIGSFLGANGFLSLSYTSRAFRGVGQQLLFQNPYLVAPYFERAEGFDGQPVPDWSTSALFLRTLCDRPEYSAFVRTIVIEVLTRPVSVSVAVTAAALGSPVVPTTVLRPDMMRFFLWEPSIAAIILTRLSNLQSLHLTMFQENLFHVTDEPPSEYFAYRPHRHLDPSLLFQDEVPPILPKSGRSLESVVGYSKLKRLSVCSQQLETALLTLPTLRHFAVDICDWGALSGPFSASVRQLPPIQIPELELLLCMKSKWLHEHRGRGSKSLFQNLLREFVAVKEIKVTFHYCTDREEPEYGYMSYAMLVSIVFPIHDRVEKLDLSIPEQDVDGNKTFNMELLRMRTLIPFTRLRILSIPQSALFSYDKSKRYGNDYEESVPYPIHTLFPSTLEQLDIGRVDDTVLPWIMKLLESSKQLNIFADPWRGGRDFQHSRLRMVHHIRAW